MPTTGILLANRSLKGEWTPVLGFNTAGDQSFTYSTQLGTWVRAAPHLVVARFRVTATVTHTTAAGILLLTGLQIPVVSGLSGSLSRWRGITKANFTHMGAVPGVNSITIVASGSGQTPATIAVGDIPTGGTVDFEGNVLYIP